MSLKQKALLGIFWSAIEQWGGQLLSTLVFLLLARILGPKDFGLVALATTFLAFMQIFLDQGFGQAIVQRKEVAQEHLDTAFWSNLLISLILFLITILASSQVASFFDEPKLTPVLMWMAPNFIFGGLNSVQSALLQRELNFKVLAMRRLCSTCVGGVVGVSLAFLGFGVWSLVAKQLADSITAAILLWSVSNWRPGFKLSKEHFKELFSYGINVTGINFLNYLNRNSDNFLIGYFLGATALGFYSVAYRLLLLVTEVMIGTTQKIAMPVFSRMQDDPERLRNAFYKAVKFTSIFAFPAYFGMFVLAPDLITFAFGEEWKGSIAVMKILALIGPLYAGFYYNGPMLMALGKPHWNLMINALQAVGNVVFFSLAVQWGIAAVAAAYVIRAYLVSPVTLLMINRILSIDIITYSRQYVLPLVASLVMSIALLFSRSFLITFDNIGLNLIINTVLGATVYFLTICLISPKVKIEVFELIKSGFFQRA